MRQEGYAPCKGNSIATLLPLQGDYTRRTFSKAFPWADRLQPFQAAIKGGGTG